MSFTDRLRDRAAEPRRSLRDRRAQRRQNLQWILQDLPSGVTGALAVLGAIAVGAAVIVLGGWLYRRPVTCDDPDLEDTEMSPGDVCIAETTGGEEVSRETYYDILESQQSVGFVVAAIGVLVIVLAITFATFSAGAALRERLIMRRSQRGLAMITPRPMTVILLGGLTVVAGAVAVGFDLWRFEHPVDCEGGSMVRAAYCFVASEDHLPEGSIFGAGFSVAVIGVAAAVLGRRARRRGTW